MDLLGTESTNSTSLATDHDDNVDDAKEIEQVLQDLKVFSSIKENEKLGSRLVVCIDKPSHTLVSLKRWYYGDGRDRTVQFVENRFKKAFEKINRALEVREKMLSISDEKLTRAQMLTRLQNSHRIMRLKDAIIRARNKIFPNLKATYEQDTATASRIENLAEDVDDRLKEVNASIRFLDDKSKKEAKICGDTNDL